MPHDPVKINSLQLEQVKRVKAFRLEPAPSGLTVIGGRNSQGKTSVLDAIAWALGGGKRQPSNAQHEGSVNPPRIEIQLSNGLTVKREGKNGTLKVIDPTGKRGGQQLLDEFVSQFALDLPKFLNATAKEKSQILLQILGIGDKLKQLDEQESALYSRRLGVGQVATSKTKYAEELPEYPDAPAEPLSISALIQQQQAVLARNGENARLRQNVAALRQQENQSSERIAALERELEHERTLYAKISADLQTAEKSASDLKDESTAELEKQIAEFESINSRVSANTAKAAAQDDAAQYQAQYDGLTAQIEQVRADRLALLDGAAMPLDGLTVCDGELVYRGQKWDCMSGSEQLRVATAIVRQLQPACGFVLLDKLEQMDLVTLAEFGAWLESEGLQAIATRVSTGEECSIVIEDGLPLGQTYADVVCQIPNNAQGIERSAAEFAAAETGEYNGLEF